MSDSNSIEKLTENKLTPVYITVYDFAVKLKERIVRYGGYNGVWDLIDNSFKRMESFEKIKTPKNSTKISREAFRKDVERFVSENQKNAKMTFSVKGNIVLLLHVMEKLQVSNLSELMGVSFKTKTLEQFTIDTNIQVKLLSEKLTNLNEAINNLMKRKPRFIFNRVSKDWFIILNEMKVLFQQPVSQMDTFFNNRYISYMDIFNPVLWMASYLRRFPSLNVQSVVRLISIINNYRVYFFNDTIMNKFNEEIYSLHKNNYNPESSVFILAPLYGLYFLSIMYKRYLYCLSIERKKDGKIISCFNDTNIDKNDKIYFWEGKEEDFEECLLENDYLGNYIYAQINKLYRKLHHIFMVINEFCPKISESSYDDYLEIFKGVYYILYDINLNFTKFDKQWFDGIIFEINSLKELNDKMILGISNLSLPNIDHIKKLDNYIKNIEYIGDQIDQERQYEGR